MLSLRILNLDILHIILFGKSTLSYSLFFTFGPLRSSEKSENIIGLDSYILNSLNYLNPIWINISHCLTSLLKLKITVYFLAFIASSFRVTEVE